MKETKKDKALRLGQLYQKKYDMKETKKDKALRLGQLKRAKKEQKKTNKILKKLKKNTRNESNN